MIKFPPMKTILRLPHLNSKIDILLTTLGLSVFSMLVINIIITFFCIQDLIKYTDLETISFTVKEGFYYVNEYKIEASIAFNFVGVIFLWVVMLWHTLKTVNKTIASFLL